MAYTEAELIGQLEKDLARPGELYVKDYIQQGAPMRTSSERISSLTQKH